jgi:hypothetical protein
MRKPKAVGNQRDGSGLDGFRQRARDRITIQNGACRSITLGVDSDARTSRQKEYEMRRIKYLSFGFAWIAAMGMSHAGIWKLHSNSLPGNMGTIASLQYVTDADGDRLNIQFSTRTGVSDYYYTRLQDFNGDNARYSRFCATLLSIQSTGQTVSDIFIAATGSKAIQGITVGDFF